MHKLTLRPSGEVVEIEESKNILQALREKEIYLKSSCGGHATCSDCVIKVVSGVDNLTPPPFNELKLLGNVFHITKERLACQCLLTGDVTIDISKHDKSADEVRMKSKTSSFSKQKVHTKVRKETEIKEIHEKRQVDRDEKNKTEGAWVKHWDQKNPNEGQGSKKPKKLDGNRRPKLFSTDGLENMVKSESAPKKDFKKRTLHAPPVQKTESNVESVKTKYSDDSTSPEKNSEFKSFRNKDKK